LIASGRSRNGSGEVRITTKISNPDRRIKQQRVEVVLPLLDPVIAVEDPRC